MILFDVGIVVLPALLRPTWGQSLTEHDRPSRPRFHHLLLAIGLPLLAAGAFGFGLSSGDRSVPQPDEWATKLIDVPPVSAMPAVPAKVARLRPDAPVIGVTVGTWHRAYPIESMSQSRSHIVNDVLDDQAVTVAYCDRTHCARVFVDPDRASPLDLAVGGWFNEDGAKDMLVRVGPNRYRLKSGKPLDADGPPFPYEGVEVEIVTWHEWRTAHPDTDVFQSAAWPVVQN